MTKITKAVIALAGYGTRFLPATKVQPKEMLPIIDKPVIQYLVEELIDSGIEDIIMVTRGQYSLESHFDNNIDLESHLAQMGKETTLKKLLDLPKKANYIYVRQKKHLPYGNGTPLLVAKNLIKDEEQFIYMFGDDLVKSKTPATLQLINFAKDNPKKIILAGQIVPDEDIEKYGIIEFKDESSLVSAILEKPNINDTKSRLAIFGRFVLNKDVLIELDKKTLGKDNELWLSDAISRLAKKDMVIATKIEGQWLTTGDPLSFLKTTVEYIKDREDLWDDFRKYLKKQI